MKLLRSASKLKNNNVSFSGLVTSGTLTGTKFLTWTEFSTLTVTNVFTVEEIVWTVLKKNCFDKSVASKLDLYDYEKYLPDKSGDRGVVLYIHKSLTAFKVDILSDSDFSEFVFNQSISG
jgi:hypothetical protein